MHKAKKHDAAVMELKLFYGRLKEYLHNFKGLYFDSYSSDNVSGNSYAEGTQIVSCLSHGKDSKKDSLHSRTYNDFVIISVLSHCSNEIPACYICHTTLLISFLFI